MKLTDRYDGSESPFEGDRPLVWRSLPAGARVTKAILTLTPAPGAVGGLFEELIAFADGRGDWGATKNRGDGFVEVDFHARRTLAAATGSNIAEAAAGSPRSNLQVDVGGGVYVEINDKGALKAPGDALFSLKSDGRLPGLAVVKLKFSRAPGNAGALDVTRVAVRSLPTQVSVRLGNLPPFWTHLGELTAADTSPDFAAVLQAFLNDAKADNGFFSVPLILHSDSIARLQATLEVDYRLEVSAMPPGLDEVNLPYDFGSLPNAPENLLALAVPAGMRAAPGGAAGRVKGAFEESRIVFGPTGAVTPAGSAGLPPGTSQAQPVAPPETATAAAFDLLVVAARAATLQLDLREDLDGKPGGASLLPAPVTFGLPAPVGAPEGKTAPVEPRWVSVALPAEVRFVEGQRSWLLLQCLAGEASWSAAPAAAGALGMQHTADSGLSWRDTPVAGISGVASAVFRLRRKPERYQLPIALAVGAGEQAVRVGLDRLQALGRLDFALDLAEISEAVNRYLDGAPATACPAAEHLSGGDFERWHRVGETLSPPAPVVLDANPAAIAVAPDGARAVVVGSSARKGVLQIIDVMCSRTTGDPLRLEAATGADALALSPDATRAYIAHGRRLLAVDLNAPAVLGDPLGLEGPAAALAASLDGRRLYVAEYDPDATEPLGTLRVIDTALLEHAVRRGAPVLEEVTLGAPLSLGGLQEPTAMAASPDGSRLYAAIDRHDAGNGGEVRILDAATLEPLAAPVPVGQGPKAVAVTPDGAQAVVGNTKSHDLTIIETTTFDAFSVDLGHSATAVAIAAYGMRAYVASGSGQTASIIDLAGRRVSGTIALGAPQRAIAVTPAGDRIYAIESAADGSGTLVSIQVGSFLPVEWNLTAGRAAPFCLPDPFHLTALIGERPALKGEDADPAPAAMSQTVPVVASCLYEFSFYGIASDEDALAEVLWIGRDCALLRTDRVPIQPVERAARKELLLASAVAAAAQPPLLKLHRTRMAAPAGAGQAEVRFSTPGGVQAVVDQASLSAAAEALTNADLSLREEGRLAGWDLQSSPGSGVRLVTVEGGVQLRNAGAETAGLVQSIPVAGGQSFSLAFRGRATRLQSAAENPRLELHWPAQDGTPAGAPVALEILPDNFDFAAASGLSPAAAAEAELHLTAPPGTTLEITYVSLRFTSASTVPLTFIAEAPGQLSVSNWRVAFEEVAPAAPRVPEKGLCAPTPPGRAPGESSAEGCFCPNCETAQPLTAAETTVTRAGRAAVSGPCPGCGARLTRFGAAFAPGGRPAFPKRASTAVPVMRLPAATRGAAGKEAGAQPKAAANTPLTAIPGIGKARARRLAGVGIDSLEKLAAAAPERVASALKNVSVRQAAEFIERGRRALSTIKMAMK
jgi:DNA-binding beta-propeller fold protein YncE